MLWKPNDDLTGTGVWKKSDDHKYFKVLAVKRLN